MPRCLGTTINKGQRKVCHYSLYHCKKCGNIGCNRHDFSQCSNQAFVTSRCLVCGAKGEIEFFFDTDQ